MNGLDCSPPRGEPTAPSGHLLALPGPLLQLILASAGGKAGCAVRCCRALRDTWRSALLDPNLAAEYLIGRFGSPHAAAEQLYGSPVPDGRQRGPAAFVPLGPGTARSASGGVLSHRAGGLMRGMPPQQQGLYALALVRALASRGALWGSHGGAGAGLEDALVRRVAAGAARSNHVLVVLELLRRGVDPGAALQGACEGGHPQLAALLLPLLLPPLASIPAVRQLRQQALQELARDRPCRSAGWGKGFPGAGCGGGKRCVLGVLRREAGGVDLAPAAAAPLGHPWEVGLAQEQGPPGQGGAANGNGVWEQQQQQQQQQGPAVGDDGLAPVPQPPQHQGQDQEQEEQQQQQPLPAAAAAAAAVAPQAGAEPAGVAAAGAAVAPMPPEAAGPLLGPFLVATCRHAPPPHTLPAAPVPAREPPPSDTSTVATSSSKTTSGNGGGPSGSHPSASPPATTAHPPASLSPAHTPTPSPPRSPSASPPRPGPSTPSSSHSHQVPQDPRSPPPPPPPLNPPHADPPAPDHLAVAKLLLACGADPRFAGSTALVHAAQRGAGTLVSELLAAGADPRAGGSRPLVAAGELLRVRVVQQLLGSGAYSGHDVRSVLTELLVPPPVARLVSVVAALVPWLALGSLLLMASTPVVLCCVLLCIWNGLWVVSALSLLGYGAGLAVVAAVCSAAAALTAAAWSAGVLLMARFVVRAVVRRAALSAEWLAGA